jgi:hypothetical protein
MQYVQLVPVQMLLEMDSKSLIQFDVIGSKLISINNGTLVRAELKFQRKIMYHLANTYLPTISLLVITEITLFFNDSKLEMALTLSVTVMLVMYTLYQSISLTIPMTAYLKFIDNWLIFCLLVPFLIVITESYWYFQQASKHTTGLINLLYLNKNTHFLSFTQLLFKLGVPQRSQSYRSF